MLLHLILIALSSGTVQSCKYAGITVMHACIHSGEWVRTDKMSEYSQEPGYF